MLIKGQRGDHMNHRNISRLCLKCFGVASILVCAFAFCGRQEPIAATFGGARQVHGLCEAVVSLTNRGAAVLECEGWVACSRLDRDENLEFSLPIHIRLGGKTSTNLVVTVPFGTGPIRVSCSVDVLGQHSSFVRSLGAFLARAGINIFHSTPVRSRPIGGYLVNEPIQITYPEAKASNLRVQLRAPRPHASLSDRLVLHRYTNLWTSL